MGSKKEWNTDFVSPDVATHILLQKGFKDNKT